MDSECFFGMCGEDHLSCRDQLDCREWVQRAFFENESYNCSDSDPDYPQSCFSMNFFDFFNFYKFFRLNCPR